jgi:hypothetical protein
LDALGAGAVATYVIGEMLAATGADGFAVVGSGVIGSTILYTGAEVIGGGMVMSGV